jgi:hypothetical protein
MHSQNFQVRTLAVLSTLLMALLAVPPGSPAQSIVGPSTTDWESWKGVVAISIGGQGLCTGTLIDPQLVLTAGHCSYNNPPAMEILSGSDVWSATSIARGEEIIWHPQWSGMLMEGAVDLSMIKLDRAVTDIETFMVRDFPMPEIGTPARLVGYGEDESGQAAIQREADTTLLDVKPGSYETGDPANTCSGDSGGPVFTEQDGKWVVTGVNSAVTGACNPISGGIAVNLLGFCDWLNQSAIELVGHDLGLENCVACDVEPVEDWGQGCGPELPPCPEGTSCTQVPDYSKNGYGYCAAPCCEVDSLYDTHCTDTSGGAEHCSLLSENGVALCMIECEEDDDCPEHSECHGPFGMQGICIARKGIPGYEPPDTDTGEDAGSGGDADGDSGVEADGGAEDDDVDAGGGEETGGSDSGCGCRQGGHGPGILRLLATL